MAMQLTLSDDLEALVEKRLATGAYADAQDVLRCALEAQEVDEDDEWTEEERRAVSDHIEIGYQQAQRGELIGQEELEVRFAAFKNQRLKGLDRG